MILVAGGTGRLQQSRDETRRGGTASFRCRSADSCRFHRGFTLGSTVVSLLRHRGLNVRVLTRDRSRAAHLVGADVAAVAADARDPAAVHQAAAGVRQVVPAIQGLAGTTTQSLATVDRGGNHNLIRAAREAGVG